MKSATIYDVADLAGVSHQTVSRFLSGYEGIRPGTREKVERALTELNYRPNSAARLLRARRTNRIGYLADRIDQSGPSRTLVGASQAARDLGYVLDVVPIDGGDEASITVALDIITQDQVAGIVISAQTREARAALDRRALPIPIARDFDLYVGATTEKVNESAGRIAAEHLLDLGHRRVAYVAGPSSWTASIDRASAFSDAIHAGGGTVVATDEGDWSARSGHAAGVRLARQAAEFTAVATANDAMAIGLLAAFAAAELRVPGDVSVIGTDDTPDAEFMSPPLTTVAMHFGFEGRFVVTSLVAQLEGRPPEGMPLLPTPEVVARASTAAPRTPVG